MDGVLNLCATLGVAGLSLIGIIIQTKSKEKQEQINILKKENASNYSKLEYHYKQKRTFNCEV